MEKRMTVVRVEPIAMVGPDVIVTLLRDEYGPFFSIMEPSWRVEVGKAPRGVFLEPDPPFGVDRA